MPREKSISIAGDENDVHMVVSLRSAEQETNKKSGMRIGSRGR